MSAKNYDHRAIEAKWREKWEEDRVFQVDLDKAKRPFYNLMMFPYPSAEGLHVGNVYAFTGSDIYGRYKRMCGYDVFEPMGFDAFGIHSENYAIKVGSHPAKLIPKNIRRFREEQLKLMGAIFDWEHTVDTTSPDYYRWTQWIFLQLYKADLAYRKDAPVNWCPSCNTVLSDEQCQGGVCERCSQTTTTRQMRQWFFKITHYQEKLLENLDRIDWSESTVTAQRQWIGKSEGAGIRFSIVGASEELEVYTTRPDTLFGATYMVISPEHPLVSQITDPAQKREVDAYREASRKKTKKERMEDREKSGVFTGAFATNPVNGRDIPIWVSDYVLMEYGTGAIMAVPAHDDRDFEFAEKYDLPIVQVIRPEGTEGKTDGAYTGEGVMINSGAYNGQSSAEGGRKITQDLEKRGLGRAETRFRLRDWCISRQRYWGPPIPMIHCPRCGVVPVPEEELPVLLPQMDEVRPDGSGLSVLERSEEFMNVSCPRCGDAARRDSDVSDNFLDSAWYFLRYPSTDFDDRAFDEERTAKWLPVDAYLGGNEHAVLHLMYTRFITMALKDMGLIPFEEPFKKFRAHGMLLKGGEKMSKNRGNVVNPDEFFARVGADAFRMYLMFLGPYQQGGDWSDDGIVGTKRFLDRLWSFVTAEDLKPGTPTDRDRLGLVHRTVRKVTRDYESLNYNTAIAAMMKLLNGLAGDKACREEAEILTRLICPISPHIAEELWEHLGGEGYCSTAPWPEYDEELCRENIVTIVVQVNGKLRDRFSATPSASRSELIEMARGSETIRKHLQGKTVVKEVCVPGKLVNFVVK